MRQKPFWMFPLFALAFLAFAALAGYVVMRLWNAVIPDIFPGAAQLDFWHAAGLLVLCRILFGGFGGGHSRRRRWGKGGKGPWNGGPPWGRQWRNLSEEEKAKFREEWRKRRCGPPASEE